MGLLSFSCSSQSQRRSADTSSQRPSPRVLVAYFSCTGTTQKVAEAIAQATDGTLYRITPEQPYTASDLDWHNAQSRSSVEMKDEHSRPAIGGEALDMADYDVIFVGYPIWWDLCPRPVNTFIEKYEFAGKEVIPFATSGGSSITHSVQELKSLYPRVEWEEGCLLNDGRKEAAAWSRRVLGLR